MPAGGAPVVGGFSTCGRICIKTGELFKQIRAPRRRPSRGLQRPPPATPEPPPRRARNRPAQPPPEPPDPRPATRPTPSPCGERVAPPSSPLRQPAKRRPSRSAQDHPRAPRTAPKSRPKPPRPTPPRAPRPTAAQPARPAARPGAPPPLRRKGGRAGIFHRPQLCQAQVKKRLTRRSTARIDRSHARDAPSALRGEQGEGSGAAGRWTAVSSPRLPDATERQPIAGTVMPTGDAGNPCAPPEIRGHGLPPWPGGMRAGCRGGGGGEKVDGVVPSQLAQPARAQASCRLAAPVHPGCLQPGQVPPRPAGRACPRATNPRGWGGGSSRAGQPRGRWVAGSSPAMTVEGRVDPGDDGGSLPAATPRLDQRAARFSPAPARQDAPWSRVRGEPGGSGRQRAAGPAPGSACPPLAEEPPFVNPRPRHWRPWRDSAAAPGGGRAGIFHRPQPCQAEVKKRLTGRSSARTAGAGSLRSALRSNAIASTGQPRARPEPPGCLPRSPASAPPPLRGRACPQAKARGVGGGGSLRAGQPRGRKVGCRVEPGNDIRGAGRSRTALAGGAGWGPARGGKWPPDPLNAAQADDFAPAPARRLHFTVSMTWRGAILPRAPASLDDCAQPENFMLHPLEAIWRRYMGSSVCPLRQVKPRKRCRHPVAGGGKVVRATDHVRTSRAASSPHRLGLVCRPPTGPRQD
jgi:hypothetical protein